MNAFSVDWESRIAAVWERAGTMAPDELVCAIDALAQERSARDAAAIFERACARDTAGLEAQAELLYRAALTSGELDEYRRARANVQLGSTLRALGRLEESEQVLRSELERHLGQGGGAVLHDEARAIMALTYLAQGRANEAAGLLLATLGPHLSRYRQTVATHAAHWNDLTW